MGEYIRNTIYESRQHAELTQEKLAKLVHVSRQTIIAIEKGNYTPSVLLALKLAHIFKTTVESLFTIKK
jgi:putative transcriptional regulator